MRLNIQATPEEIRAKGDALIKALADTFRATSPELAGRLDLASAEPAVVALRAPALRELQEMTQAAYAGTLQAMLEEVYQVIDRGLNDAQG